MSKVIHVAGGPVVINRRVIQRCSACGITIIDAFTNIVVGKEGDDVIVQKVRVWEPNMLMLCSEMAGARTWTPFKTEKKDDESGEWDVTSVGSDLFCTKEDYPSDDDRPTQWKEVPPEDQTNPSTGSADGAS